MDEEVLDDSETTLNSEYSFLWRWLLKLNAQGEDALLKYTALFSYLFFLPILVLISITGRGLFGFIIFLFLPLFWTLFSLVFGAILHSIFLFIGRLYISWAGGENPFQQLSVELYTFLVAIFWVLAELSVVMILLLDL